MSMDLRVGFIGGGAMAEAIVAGIVQGTVSPSDIYVSDHKEARCQQLAEQYGIHASVGADSFVGMSTSSSWRSSRRSRTRPSPRSGTR